MRVAPVFGVAALAVMASGVSGVPSVIFAISPSNWVCAVVVVLAAALLVVLGARTVHLLGEDEQLRVQRLAGTTVHNGPGLTLLNPLGYRAAEKVRVDSLTTLDFVKVFDSVQGTEHMEQGPKLLFLGPHEKVVHKGQGISLSGAECVLVEDKLIGARRVVRGPCVWFPGPHDQGQKVSSISLSMMEYIIVENRLTGERSLVKGPTVWYPGPYDTAGRKQVAIVLQEDEYIRLKDTSTGRRWIQRGKGLAFLEPGWKAEDAKGASKAWVLKAHEYVKLLNGSTGQVTVYQGEAIIFPGPEEEAMDGGVKEAMQVDGEHAALVHDASTGVSRLVTEGQLLVPGPTETLQEVQAIRLSAAECVMVEDKLTGDRRMVRGPSVFFPGAYERVVRSASVSLSMTEFIIVEHRLTGKESLVRGPCVWFPEPYDTAGPKQTAIALQEDEFMKLTDGASGKRWIQRGKGLVFLEPGWSVTGKGVTKAWVLKANEYIKLLDRSTGQIVVHRGEAVVFPGPDDEALDGGVKRAVRVDAEHAVLVNDTSTGQQRLVTEQQLFVPGPTEAIEEVREMIKLAEHEAMIIKDKEGAFQYYYGSDEKRAPDQPRAFFLPPYCEIVKVWWSRGPRRERKDVSFERFDCRPHFMKFEFNCRTSDNVELILEGVLFWELVDLPAMWQRTGDTSGDMVYHIRSQFILHVARVTLKVFMETLHEIAKTVLEEDTEFYKVRGIKVHSLEITRYQCADKSTAVILEQIIQETTSRMNRLSQAESENEVSLFRTQGQIEQSRLNTDLLEIQRTQAQAEAHAVGQAEADRVATFMAGLTKEVPKLEDRIKMWQVLRKTEALSVVSQGGANLYFTPNDVDLSIEARSAAAPAAMQNGKT